jgi:glycosyltransferase involved in cell wall biosynthesis
MDRTPATAQVAAGPVGRGDALRILHVVESFGGGVYEVVRVLAGSLAERAQTVGVAYGVRPETPPGVEATLDPRVEVFPLPWTERTLRAQLAARRALGRLERRWQPDVIHLHSSFAGAVGAVAVGSRRPTVYSPHGYSFTMAGSRARRTAFRTIERGIARRVTTVGAVSHSEAALAAELGTARAIVTVPNGIPELDAPAGAPPDRPAAPLLVVAMGRVMAQRRPEQAAEILAAARDAAQVLWVGGGRDDEPDAEVLQAAGIPVTGWCGRDEALAHLGRATVYVHWTAWDGLPLSVLEAMARDVIVVASDIAANRDVVGPRQVFATVAGAQAFLRRVLADAGLRAELLAEQRERARAFGAEAMADGWLAVYRSLVGARA